MELGRERRREPFHTIHTARAASLTARFHRSKLDSRLHNKNLGPILEWERGKEVTRWRKIGERKEEEDDPIYPSFSFLIDFYLSLLCQSVCLLSSTDPRIAQELSQLRCRFSRSLFTPLFPTLFSFSFEIIFDDIVNSTSAPIYV